MAIKITESKIMHTVDWAYYKAVNGVTGLDSASELAQHYLNTNNILIEQVKSLIRWQNTKAGTSGFLSGLGGIITIPVTIPANITSVMYLQIRMIAAIAYMGGHDLNDDKIKALVYICLTGTGAKNILQEIKVKNVTEDAIKNISNKTIFAINHKVGFRLLAEFGEQSIISIGKSVPLLGGFIGASFDSFATNTIGNIAMNTFIHDT